MLQVYALDRYWSYLAILDNFDRFQEGILQAARGVLASSNFLAAEAGIVGARVVLNVARGD